jgi:hypothetical protein
LLRLGAVVSVFLGGLTAGSLNAAVASSPDTIVTVTLGAQQRSAHLALLLRRDPVAMALEFLARHPMP